MSIRSPRKAASPPALTKTALPLEAEPTLELRPHSQLHSLRIDCHHVLIAFLGESSEPEAVNETLRSFLYRAANARMWLSAERKDDLLLVLVGPQGAHGARAWEAHASQMERDDRICRKLVWLPPRRDQTLENDADLFLQRTFLARPWDTDVHTQPQELDARERLRRALAERDLVRPGDLAILNAWWPILARFAGQDDTTDAAEIVEELTKALPAGSTDVP